MAIKINTYPVLRDVQDNDHVVLYTENQSRASAGVFSISRQTLADFVVDNAPVGLTITDASVLPNDPDGLYLLTTQYDVGNTRYHEGLYFGDGTKWSSLTGRIEDRTPTPPVTTYTLTYGLSNLAHSTLASIISPQTREFRDGQTLLISQPQIINVGQYWVLDIESPARITKITDELFDVDIRSAFSVIGNRYALGPLNSGTSQNYKITVGV